MLIIIFILFFIFMLLLAYGLIYVARKSSYKHDNIKVEDINERR